MKNLKLLQKESGKTIKEVASELGLPFSTYNNYLLGTREPSIEILIKLSNYFNVSIDYLVGNDTAGKTIYSEEQKQIFNMVANLNNINTIKAYSYISGLLAGQE
ncbi:MAG: helix-turn-helix transcriptional regulator [Clostridia bacterium]|nr:helix-turn-helix transcriptional regulator [Clostridia bacterium]